MAVVPIRGLIYDTKPKTCPGSWSFQLQLMYKNKLFVISTLHILHHKLCLLFQFQKQYEAYYQFYLQHILYHTYLVPYKYFLVNLTKFQAFYILSNCSAEIFPISDLSAEIESCLVGSVSLHPSTASVGNDNHSSVRVQGLANTFFKRFSLMGRH